MLVKQLKALLAQCRDDATVKWCDDPDGSGLFVERPVDTVLVDITGKQVRLVDDVTVRPPTSAGYVAVRLP